MADLTLLEKDALDILKRLEYSCDRIKLFKPSNKIVEVLFGDIDFSLLRRGVDLYMVAGYLRENGLNFLITYDLVNDSPIQDVYFGWSETEEEVELGKIEDKNINEIEKKIKNLINKLEIKKTKNNKEEQSFWISKDENGNYSFDGNRVYIKSKDADYAVIFDVIYSMIPQGGKVQYKDIIEKCKQRDKKIKKESIFRALTGKDANFFRYIKEVKQSPRFNIDLFTPMQNGKEIEFNNKK